MLLDFFPFFSFAFSFFLGERPEHDVKLLLRGPEHDPVKKNCSGVLGKTPLQKTARNRRGERLFVFDFY